MKRNFWSGLCVAWLVLWHAICMVSAQVRTGAERMELLLPLLQDKRVGIVSNATGVVGPNATLLADTLLSRGVKVVRIFSPEHGYRGMADAGAVVDSGRDCKTGLPVVSLYGNNKKPTAKQVKGLDVLLFDLQDVGTRFYTYISTLHYVMEAAAENGVEVIVADRPNPNDFIDGPILQPAFRSFVGMHPIPVLHGLTVGELALMINGERWLDKGVQCLLSVIPVEGWKHGDSYRLPVAPSPNLKNQTAIRRYPSLCFFEATPYSVGRGTQEPFCVVGYPNKKVGNYSFVPQSIPGASKPKYQGKRCYGQNFVSRDEIVGLQLQPLLYFRKKSKQMGISLVDRPRFFDLLAGTNQLRLQLQRGASEKEIRESWRSALLQYKALRKKYLIYPDERP